MDTETAMRGVNNTFYGELGERWYAADDDPVALLRAEARLRNPWVERVLEREFGRRPVRVLDVGCGAGFLANDLARRGHDVTGIDLSKGALDVARKHDATDTVRYEIGDALAPSFPGGSFDAVCALDLLEHVENPGRVVHEAGRVLRPNGLFFFHTFNRNPIAWLVGIKGVAWFVKHTPPRMHVLDRFIKPAELRKMLDGAGLSLREWHGSAPVVDRAFARMLFTGIVPPAFRFRFTRSLVTGYTGYARKP